MADKNRKLDASYDDRALDRGTAANRALGANDADDNTVGEATGGLAGAATGAALGSLGGPIGTIIGGIAGAVGGWWSGRAISQAAHNYTEDDDAYYRSQFESRNAGGALRPDDRDARYDDYRPAYQLGHLAAQNPDYRERDFSDIESDLQRGWSGDVSRRYGTWEDVREHARSGYERGREASLTLSREELEVGRRQVEAGSAKLRKTVETEHVQQTVPVQREELRVERRPIDANASADVRIEEDEIVIPLTREELVVEKRAVPVEEVVVRKDVVTEDRTVEADLRHERLDENSLRSASGRGVKDAGRTSTDREAR